MINDQAVKTDIAKGYYAKLGGMGFTDQQRWQQAIDFAESNSSLAVLTASGVVLQKLQDEITNDPAKLGYAGKTYQDICDLLNEPRIDFVTSTETVNLQEAIKRELALYEISADYVIKPDGSIVCDNAAIHQVLEEISANAKIKLTQEVTSKIELPARISEVLDGVPYSANALLPEDVATIRSLNVNP